MSNPVTSEWPPPDERTGPPCGYSVCDRRLPAKTGRGPKFSYCPDRTWEGGRTCKEMAAAERAALEAAGTAGPLDVVARLLDRADAAGGPIAELHELYTEIRQALSTTVTEAMAATREANQKAGEANARAEAAERAARSAGESARQAENDRTEAIARATEADQRARTAQRDAEQQVGAAHRRVAEHERARGLAEGIAATAEQAARQETRRRESAETEVRALREELARVRVDADERARSLREQLDAARAGESDARTKAAELKGQLETAKVEHASLRRQVDDLTAEADAVRQTRDAADQRAAGLAAELESARQQRDEAQSAARQHADRAAHLEREVATATDRADTEARRLTELLARLGAPGAQAQADR
ncbi:coiled-coil domain-containing protein [Micromonospora aurantiaca (nom. illeg.)]|uniref:hypothetical protein n=1 Tax=Micromonospora aurantiaca (nom. illeg.) TaxID=47850 RepID=UPI0033EE5D29